MRVFLAATSLAPHYGGPAISVSRLALALAAKGAEVGLWSADRSIQTTDLLPKEQPKGLTYLSGSARSALEQFSPDVLHDNGLWLFHNHRLASLAWHHGLTRLVSTRGMLEPWARSHKKWKKDLAWALYQHRDLERASAIHATAASESQNLARWNLGVPVHTVPDGVDIPDFPAGEPVSEFQNMARAKHVVPVYTIPNGVDIPELPERNLARINASGRTAVYLGRLYPIKGLPMLIRAWDRVRPEGWRLVLAGPDEAGHKSELESLIRETDLAGVVSFMGPVAGAAKSQFLAGADLFVSPSYSESFGIAVAEALAHGLPVLTTNSTPWRTLRQHGCGWSVDATLEGVTEGLSEATSHDKETLAAMGTKGRAWVSSEFGWERVAKQFMAAYQQALA